MLQPICHKNNENNRPIKIFQKGMHLEFDKKTKKEEAISPRVDTNPHILGKVFCTIWGEGAKKNVFLRGRAELLLTHQIWTLPLVIGRY